MAGSPQFSSWLSSLLESLGADESVFLPYLSSILETEVGEEREEGLRDILQDILQGQEDKIDETLQSLIARWEETQGEPGADKGTEQLNKEVESLDLTEKMHQITQQKLANFSSRKVEQTEEQKAMKAAILQGYSEVPDGCSDSESGEEGDGGGGLGPANSNAESAMKEQVEQRAKQAAAAQAKKDKDKQDRANQKSQQEERKKKAQDKAAKGERKSGR